MIASESGVDNDEVVAPTTFIVRARRDGAGGLSGVVERAATGEKGRFQGADGLVELIQRMLADAKDPPAGPVVAE